MTRHEAIGKCRADECCAPRRPVPIETGMGHYSSSYYRFEQFESVSSSSNTSSSTQSMSTKMTTFSAEIESHGGDLECQDNYLLPPDLPSSRCLPKHAFSAARRSPSVQLDTLKLSPSCRISSAKITRVNSFSKVASNQTQQVSAPATHVKSGHDRRGTFQKSFSRVLPLTSRSLNETQQTEQHLAPIWSPPNSTCPLNYHTLEEGPALAGYRHSVSRPAPNALISPAVSRRQLDSLLLRPSATSDSSSSTDDSSMTPISSDESQSESESDYFNTNFGLPFLPYLQYC